MNSRPKDKKITFDGNEYETFRTARNPYCCDLIRWKKDEAEIHLPEKIKDPDEDRIEYDLYAISACAFDKCQRIITVNIPANVRIFRHHCFSRKRLESTIEKIIFCDNPDLEIIENCAFENCKKLKYIKFSQDQDINMEETDLSKPEHLKQILGNAFSGCESLKNIKLPSNSNLSLGTGCFSGSGIEKVTIPKSCKSLENSMFSESSIKEIIFEEDSQLEIVMEKAFFKCQKLSKIEFPPSVKELCKESFAESSIEEIKCPNLEVVGDNAFQKCKKLKRITISSTIYSIGAYAFSESSIPSLDFIECENGS